MFMIQKLNFDGCADEAIGLYQRAFNAVVRSKIYYREAVAQGWEKECPEKNDKVYHSEVMFGNQEVRMDDLSGWESVELTRKVEHLIGMDTVEEVETAFAILAENGSVISPLERPPYMHIIGTVRDPFGVCWTLMCDFKHER